MGPRKFYISEDTTPDERRIYEKIHICMQYLKALPFDDYCLAS